MKVRQAVVLAAGRGKRMGQLTEALPKPMIPVHGKPMLQHVLERLAATGVQRVALVVGYRREAIVEHFRDFPLELQFLVQEDPNGTASAAALARNFTSDEPFLLTFGDILVDGVEYTAIAARLTPETQAVIGVRWAPDPWRGAAVYAEDGRVVRIVEKPAPGTSTTNWNSAGLYVFRPSLYPALEQVPLSPRGEYELTSAVEGLLSAGHQLALHPIEHQWRDVGTPEDLRAVDRS